MRELDFRTVFMSDRAGYGLATANILYHMPERPKLLQTFVWQFYDVAPDYPRLIKFLDFWMAEIDGIIHSVEVAHRQLARPRPRFATPASTGSCTRLRHAPGQAWAAASVIETQPATIAENRVDAADGGARGAGRARVIDDPPACRRA